MTVAAGPPNASHFGRDVILDQISDVACVSRYHMSRIFAVSMGIPVMRYLRARRLSEAAGALANGAPDILSVALDVGYGSHEAFTRAFREHFGVTQESVRTQGHLNNLRLMEAMKMHVDPLNALEARPLIRIGEARYRLNLNDSFNHSCA